MKTFGLVYVAGYSEQGNEILKKIIFPENKIQHSLHIDAGFFVNVLPGYSLNSLVKLTQFMELRRFDTVTVYEITKKSCMKAFDKKLKPQDIFERLTAACSHEVPQNILSSVEEWYQQYDSVSLYRGFVLKVNLDKKVYIESNKILSSHILEELAPGIFLLDFKSDEQASEIIEKSGLDFIGNTKFKFKCWSKRIFSKVF